MLNNYMAMLLINEKDQDIRPLTQERALSTLHVGGRYKVIDFAMSNLTNAGIGNIGIFTENKWLASLHSHVKSGENWDLGRKKDGISYYTNSFNRGQLVDVKNIENNLLYFTQSTQENVIVIDPEMIYKIDFEEVAAQHERDENDITLIYKKVRKDLKNFRKCESIILDKDNNVTASGKVFYQEDAEENILLGCYIIKKDVFLRLVCDSAREKKHISPMEIFSGERGAYKVQGYEYKGYLRCIDSIKNYFEFNMDLLNDRIKNEIFFENGHIYTKVQDTPPTVYGENTRMKNSLLANGCIVNGEIRNSVIGRRVTIEEGALVENCIICQGCTIRKGAQLKNLIVTRKNIIGENEQLMGSLNNPLVIEKGDTL